MPSSHQEPSFQREPTLDPAEFIRLLEESTLAERRPADDLERITAMIRHSNLIVTARDAAGRLIGAARSVTDFAYCCYLSDLAVARDHQRQGLGARLMELTESFLHPGATLILLAAPKAVDYYPKVGFTRHEAAYVRRRGDRRQHQG